MTSDQATRTMIASVLAGVTGIGRIHQYEREFRTEAEFRSLHQTANSKVLSSATIGFTAFGAADTAMNRRRDRTASSVEATYEIKLMMGQVDASASQVTLGELVRTVFLEFEKETAHDVFRAAGMTYAPIDAQPIGMAQYGGEQFKVLVNQAILTLKLTEEIG